MALAPRDRGPEAGVYAWRGTLAEGDCLDRLADERLKLRPGDVRPGQLSPQLLDQVLRLGPDVAGLRERLSDMAEIDVSRKPAREGLDQVRAR